MLLGNIRVVLLGQELYKSISKVNGSSCSIDKGYPNPPSSMNIIKERSEEIEKFTIPSLVAVSLNSAIKVYLLNFVLTIKSTSSRIHDVLLQQFTTTCIKLCFAKGGVIFVLWERLQPHVTKKKKTH